MLSVRANLLPHVGCVTDAVRLRIAHQLREREEITWHVTKRSATAASAALANLANTSVQATVGSAAGLAVVANGSSAAAGTTAGSASWSAWQLGSRTVWSPVTNLDLSVDVVYTRVNTAFGGSVGPSTHGTYENKSFWAGMFRAQRNFYP